ncbi:anti-anti-sigma factor [Caulobacter sp. BP25]|nr:anti-anti-sigma factor [Caulobacter sp. BP25]
MPAFVAGIYFHMSGGLVLEYSEKLVSFSGSLTIGVISERYSALVGAMEQGAPVVIGLDEVTEVDLTFAQLLEAARRTAADRGQVIRLEKPAEGPLLQVLQRGGFLDPEDADRVNFWVGGKTQS